ncbi:MAG: accessory gene regulator ArgB-like protein [Acutalibacteraceae bacterium]
MIYKTSRHITDKLIRHGRVDSDDRELFEYGIFLVISQIIYALVCIICGIVFKCIAESLVLYVSFNFARKYSGGFHASTELRCFIISSLSILCSVSLIKTFEIKDLRVPFIILLAAASAVIIIFSPLDTDEKPLTEDEKILFRKKSFLVLGVLLAVCIAAFPKLRFISYSAGTAVILESVFLSLGKLKKLFYGTKKYSM